MRAWMLSLVVACGTSQTPPSPDVGFHTRVFGRGPNATAVMRVKDTLRDPLYGPYFRKALEKSNQGTHTITSLAGQVDEIDVACDVHPNAPSRDVACTVVVYGSLGDPSEIRDGERAMFDTPTHLASGATEWAVPSSSDWALFATSDAWTFAHGASTEALRKAFTASASPPPRLDLEPTALAAVSIRGSALDAHDVDRRSLDGSERVIAQALDVGELVVMPSSSGDVITRFWMMDEDSAKIVEGELLAAMRGDALCDSACKLVRAIVASAIDVRRENAFVAVRVHLPESILRKLLSM